MGLGMRKKTKKTRAGIRGWERDGKGGKWYEGIIVTSGRSGTAKG